ncbi:hypothetical protein D3C75_1065630 [compost metagenome]
MQEKELAGGTQGVVQWEGGERSGRVDRHGAIDAVLSTLERNLEICHYICFDLVCITAADRLYPVQASVGVGDRPGSDHYGAEPAADEDQHRREAQDDGEHFADHRLRLTDSDAAGQRFYQ